MRRDPPFEQITPVHLASVSGTQTVITANSTVNPGIVSVAVASLGAAGTAIFTVTTSGSVIKTLAVAANESADGALHLMEIGLGNGLEVTTTTAMAVDVLYVATDGSPGITKSAARAAAYAASKTSPKATRAPNIFGAQSQG